AAAERGVKTADDGLTTARQRLDRFAPGPDTKPLVLTPVPWLHDTFAAVKPDVLKAVSGQWAWERGRLVQKQAGAFLTLATLKNHPQDFMGRVRYRTTGGSITSVGIAFDVVGTKSWQAIYTHCTAGSSAVQAFHRARGREVYPQEGIVP